MERKVTEKIIHEQKRAEQQMKVRAGKCQGEDREKKKWIDIACTLEQALTLEMHRKTRVLAAAEADEKISIVMIRGSRRGRRRRCGSC